MRYLEAIRQSIDESVGGIQRFLRSQDIGLKFESSLSNS